MASQADIYSILSYFGSDSSIYKKIQLGTATNQEISYALSQIPRLQADVTATGTVLGYTYADPVYVVPTGTSDIVSGFDSNYGGSGYGGGVSGRFPVSVGRDGTTQQASLNPGSTSLGASLTAVVDRVALGVTGVNLGCKLGKKIDEALYNLDPEWWDTHYPSINPQTWDSICGESETGKKFFRTLFGISDTGDVTGYVDERVLAQTYQMLRDLGLWQDSSVQTVTNPNYPGTPSIQVASEHTWQGAGGIPWTTQGFGTSPVYVVRPNISEVMLVSNANFYTYSGFPPAYPAGQPNATKVSDTAYYWIGGTAWGPNQYGPVLQVYQGLPTVQDVCDYIFSGGTISGGGIDGMSDISGATQYPPTAITGTTLPDVLQQLKQNYPHLFDGSISEDVLQEDGTIETRTYVPVPWVVESPLEFDQTSPVTMEDVSYEQQTDPKIDQQIAPDIVVKTEDTTPSPLDDPQPDTPIPEYPDTGEGDTPVPAIPTGSASSLWAIYNPTQAQVDAFGAWLWSSDFVEQLKKLFNDPMQAIIGIHKVFATPSTGAAQTIKCGYLNSGVSSAVVTSQYTSVDCGSANLREYFGNVFDYDPYTRVSLFLPFIGIVPLNVSEVMRSTVSVKYKVDVLSGACLAEVSIKRDNSGGILYTYSGSAIVSYPVSSGSYIGVVQAALSTALGIGSAIASGGATLGVSAGMVMGGLSRAKTQVQHSGQFSGAAGAMGGKKPYLIVIRPQTRTPEKINEYAGYPSNAIHRLSECSGYTRVREVHVASTSAYDNELQEIETLLKTGVIV